MAVGREGAPTHRQGEWVSHSVGGEGERRKGGSENWCSITSGLINDKCTTKKNKCTVHIQVKSSTRKYANRYRRRDKSMS